MRRSKQAAYQILSNLNSDGHSSDDEESVPAMGVHDDAEFSTNIFDQQLSDTSDSDESLPEETVASPQPPDDNDDTPVPFDIQNQQEILGKDKTTKWDCHYPYRTATSQTPVRNIIRHRGGLTPFISTHVNNPLDCFLQLLGEQNLSNIIQMSNNHLLAHNTSSSSSTSGPKPFSREELLAFIGLLIARGVFKARGEPRRSLWSSDYGRPIFSATMGINRFEQITKHLRFDDLSSRTSRRRNDKFCHIREVWESVMHNCWKSYRPFTHVTVDEQLMGCRSRCPFTQYMRNKPDKFGIKFWFICCSDTYFVLNAVPYLGKDGSRGETPVGEHVVMSLLEPYYDLGLNVTTDNFFTSVSLAKKLLQHKTTLLGTVRQNRRELPACVGQKLELHESKFFYNHSSKSLLVSYQAKANKNVLLLSTSHTTSSTEDNSPMKPLMNLEYNKTKGGVDTADQMLKFYTTRVATWRWPMNVFGNLIDIICLNSYVIWKKQSGTLQSRREFLIELSKALCQKQIENRLSPSSTLNSSLKRKLAEVHQRIQPESDKSDKRKLCKVCRKNKTRSQCLVCQEEVCGPCSLMVCQNCTQ